MQQDTIHWRLRKLPVQKNEGITNKGMIFIQEVRLSCACTKLYAHILSIWKQVAAFHP